MSETNNVEAPATDGPKLELVDIENALKVIDYACDQGAYKGWGTINQVIAVRNRLAAFLEAVRPPAPVEAEETASDETVSDETSAE